MRFLSIEIHNYRQYRDLKLDFFPGEHDLQVIIADNGVGKTNLLNSFTWCLYGVEPHLGTSQKQQSGQKTEPKLNKEVLLEAVQGGKATANVSVSIDIDFGRSGKPSVMRVKRWLPFSIASNGAPFEKKAEERLTVVLMRPGGDQVYEGERAQEFINKYLPESIREYFFFDGEQLNNYFKATGGEKIKEAVYSISQIDLFTTMADRLGKVVRSRSSEAASCSADAKKYEQAKSDAERTVAGARKYIDETKEKIDELNQMVSEVNDQLSGVADVSRLEARQKELQKKVEKLTDALKQRRIECYEFIRSYITDFYMYPIAEKALAHIREMQNGGHLPPSIDPIRLKESLKAGKCIVCEHELNDDERAHIEELLELFRVGSETSNILSSMTSELQRTIDAVARYPQLRARYLKQWNDAAAALDEEIDKLKEISAEIGRYADRSESIKELYDRRKQLNEEIQRLSESIGARQGVIKRQEYNITLADKKLRIELKKSAKARRLNSLVDFGSRALEILRNAEKAVVDETREKMAQRTEELFRGLVWKESKCDRIELSANYTPSLYDKYGFSCAGTCSAAERSLLALSFTLAMHEVSGFESPLFIDTPIARASGENRENFAKTLVEVSGHKQLILAFTPDEYSESIEKEFNPAIATLIHLRLDEDERHVMEPEVERRG